MMLDDMQARICQTQADLYEWAADEGYQFPAFSDIYLRSDFCKRAMDTTYSRFQLREPLEHLDFLIPENPQLNSCKSDEAKFDGAEAYWIGYIYRALYYETGKESKVLSYDYPFEKLLARYMALHTIDYSMAVDIILNRRLFEYTGIEFYVSEEALHRFQTDNGRPLTQADIDLILKGCFEMSPGKLAEYIENHI